MRVSTRIGVLGLGFMGSTHLKALRTIPTVQLAAVYSGNAAKLSGDLTTIQGNVGGPGERFDFSGVAKYSQIDTMLADPSIDAVDICLPTNLHAEVAVQAMLSGKHVLVEKPMALDALECATMLAAATEHNRVLMAAQVLRFFPMYAALTDVLASGNLGAVRSAMFRRRCAAPFSKTWLSDPRQSGGGVFDLLIHDVDMCLRLFGMPERVSATGYAMLESGMDVMTAELSQRGPFTTVITGGWHHPKSYPFSMEYTVVTEGGTVEYSSAGTPPTLYRVSGEKDLLPMGDADGYASEISYFVDCCRAGKRPALCPPEQSAEAVALMRLLLDARNKNGEKMPCNI